MEIESALFKLTLSLIGIALSYFGFISTLISLIEYWQRKELADAKTIEWLENIVNWNRPVHFIKLSILYLIVLSLSIFITHAYYLLFNLLSADAQQGLPDLCITGITACLSLAATFLFIKGFIKARAHLSTMDTSAIVKKRRSAGHG